MFFAVMSVCFRCFATGDCGGVGRFSFLVSGGGVVGARSADLKKLIADIQMIVIAATLSASTNGWREYFAN